EPMAGWNLHRLGKIARVAVVHARPDVAVLLRLAVAVQVAVTDEDRVPRPGDEALDEVGRRVFLVDRLRTRFVGGDLYAARGAVLGRTGRRVEDDDVADARVAEVVAQPVDEHALTDFQRRLHRAARDPVRLDEERLDQQGEAERNGDDDDELEDLRPK